MLKNKCKVCKEEVIKGSEYCSNDHKEMVEANDILNNMLWNGEIPFKQHSGS